VSLQFDRFSIEAQNVAARAYEVMGRYGHGILDVEHLALALFELPNGELTPVFQYLSLDVERVRQQLDDILRALPKTTSPDSKVYITPQLKRVIEQVTADSQSLAASQITPVHLLLAFVGQTATASATLFNNLGLTRERILAAYNGTGMPQTSGTDPWDRAYQRFNEPQIIPNEPLAPPTWREFPLAISPVFLGIVAVTAAAAAVVYMGGEYARLALFVFVVGGWVISLSLHEFGHAFVAFFGGDRGVVAQGYLTLNPLKYTHKWLSIVFPIIILAMGGIGLPGGAVYINHAAIRSRWMRSLMSAAGPFATGICALVLVIPFFLRLVGRSPEHVEFWAGLALLAFLQITALLFNLLPIPGLDGFGIIEPFLPPRILNITYTIRRFTFLIIFALFYDQTPVSSAFFAAIGLVIAILGVNPNLIGIGLDLFRFWT
jgi:Zn-dependent protease